MLLNTDESALLIVDVQSRLLPALSHPEALLERSVWLAKLAATLDIPTVISEHCPDKIGHTDAAVMAAAPAALVVKKQDFSVCAEGCLNKGILGGASQIVLAGIEAHVCVLQTALDLRQRGYQVFVVADAVDSRTAADRELALARLRDNRCQVVSSEMVAFEWLGSARHPQFKTVHRDFIR